MKPARHFLWLFLLLLGLFPALATGVKFIEHGWNVLAWFERGLLLALPGLFWLWARHYSVLGCRACADRACKSPE